MLPDFSWSLTWVALLRWLEDRTKEGESPVCLMTWFFDLLSDE